VKNVIAAIAAALTLTAAAPQPMDSAAVLQRYALELGDVTSPKAMIFGYSVSQLGLTDIEQRHMIYRSGLRVRDETLSVDGIALKPKIVSFGQREDRYALTRLAPRTSSYALLFTKTVRDGSHLDYAYDATPAGGAPAAFTVTRVVIDGISFLPREIDFKTTGASGGGSGKLVYGKADKYWMPLLATVEAQIHGTSARERIVWDGYRFPRALPPSTFAPPRPLPHATLPPI
jgi:hypothetical protein